MRRSWCTTAAACVLLSACGGSVSFMRDDRIAFELPTELERVTAPFAIEWSDDGPAPAAYAVFVDRDPIRPGTTLAAIADEACDGRPGCDGEAFLASQRIYVTEEREVEVPTLTPLGGVGGKSPERVHRATIVLLDEDGRRVGESSWSLEFREAAA